MKKNEFLGQLNLTPFHFSMYDFSTFDLIVFLIIMEASPYAIYYNLNIIYHQKLSIGTFPFLFLWGIAKMKIEIFF